jgi:hypothetical protein
MGSAWSVLGPKGTYGISSRSASSLWNVKSSCLSHGAYLGVLYVLGPTLYTIAVSCRCKLKMQHGHARWVVNDLQGGGVQRGKVYPDAVCENNKKFIIASSPGKIRTEHRQTCRACHFSVFSTSSDSPSPLTANKNFTACIHTGTQPLDHVVAVVRWTNCLCAPWPRLACFQPLFTNKSWKQRHQP